MSRRPLPDEKARAGSVHEPILGVLEWFHLGEYERVERVLDDLRAIGVRHLRTGLSWADYFCPEGPAWIDWLIRRLAREVEVLPCVLYTPPSIALEPATAAPPRNPKDYADFVDVCITRLGDCFEHIELWNEPNNTSEYDWRLDPGWVRYSAMIGAAAFWAKERGKKTVLGGLAPVDPMFLEMLFDRGVMDHIDVVGIHGFPHSLDARPTGWPTDVAKVQRLLDARGSHAEIWITEAGFSTWRHDERQQVLEFLDVVRAPVPRVYWYGAHDLDEKLPTVDGLHIDEREYHFGMKRVDGSEKILFRFWRELGVEGMEQNRWLRPKASAASDGRIVITGGAGFIGCNLAKRLLERGERVLIYDSLRRPHVERNLDWLHKAHGDRLDVEIADVRDRVSLDRALQGAREVYHLAAQVAVTTSVEEPLLDFDVNAAGTLNVLEIVRRFSDPPPVLFTSTNKVYGSLSGLELVEDGSRYEPANPRLRAAGIDEGEPLAFASPYGCSKGAADQYVLHYANTLGLRTLVFRMSCIYGPRQLGTEDQGWIAHFLLSALEGREITLYGDGKQVRDALFVDDLVDALLLGMRDIDRLAGRAFNIGGGVERTVSLLDLLDLIGELTGERPRVGYAAWRPGDQRYYVSNVTAFSEATGWAPTLDVRSGVARLYEWLRGSRRDEDLERLEVPA